MSDDPFAAAAPRPLWLTTLADLSLLLVGFFVFVQATAGTDRTAQARSFRAAFGSVEASAPIPLAAAAVSGFAPGSAVLPGSPDAAATWAREAVRDPAAAIRIAGTTDGTPADVDPESGSAAVLAADRARAVAAALARVVPGDRVTIVNAAPPMRGRRVLLTLGMAGASPLQGALR